MKLNRTLKNLLVEESVMVGLRMEDAICRSKWSLGVNLIAAWLRRIWPPSLDGDIARFSTLVFLIVLVGN